MIKNYRKKPVVVQALLWRGALDSVALREFVGDALKFGTVSHEPYIETLEGEMYVKPGDYVIRGVQGEFYPCKPDIFAATYEEAA